MSDYSQSQTDYWRGVADEREALRRFAPLPPELPCVPKPSSPPKPAKFSDIFADWEREAAEQRAREEAENKAFNKKYLNLK